MKQEIKIMSLLFSNAFFIGMSIYFGLRILEMKIERQRCIESLSRTVELCAETWKETPVTSKERQYFLKEKGE